MERQDQLKAGDIIEANYTPYRDTLTEGRLYVVRQNNAGHLYVDCKPGHGKDGDGRWHLFAGADVSGARGVFRRWSPEDDHLATLTVGAIDIGTQLRATGSVAEFSGFVEGEVYSVRRVLSQTRSARTGIVDRDGNVHVLPDDPDHEMPEFVLAD